MIKTIKPQNRCFLTIPECAEEFGFPVATVRSLVKHGAFPVMKVGSAAYIMRETFSSYLQSFAFQGSTGIVEWGRMQGRNGW